MDTVLDIFRSDAFGVVALTDAINQTPYAPGRAGTLVDWNESGVPTTSIAFEQVGNVLKIVNPTPRGGPGETREKTVRTADQIVIPHYEINDGINADEVQGVRAFGQGSMVQTVTDKVNERIAFHGSDLDATLEYQRIGALSGIILNGDGSTYINLFTKFAKTPQTEVDFNLDSVANDGSLRATCTAVVRTIAKALGGAPYSGVYAFCSDTFWDALIKNAEVRSSYLSQQEASQLRAGVTYGQFNFGGITFENYRGGVGTEEATSFIPTDKAWLFPTGVQRLFRTVYAPADYVETVNTMGLPRYARQYPWPNMKGVALDVQMNALSYCTRPRCLVKGKLT